MQLNGLQNFVKAVGGLRKISVQKILQISEIPLGGLPLGLGAPCGPKGTSLVGSENFSTPPTVLGDPPLGKFPWIFVLGGVLLCAAIHPTSHFPEKKHLSGGNKLHPSAGSTPAPVFLGTHTKQPTGCALSQIQHAWHDVIKTQFQSVSRAVAHVCWSEQTPGGGGWLAEAHLGLP